MPRLTALLESSWIAEASHTDIRALQDVLLDGEEVLFLGRGYVVRQGLPAVRRWTIAATGERLLCIRPGAEAGRGCVEIPRHTIHQVVLTRALVGSQLAIAAQNHNIRLQLPLQHLTVLQHVLTGAGTSTHRLVRTAPGSLLNDYAEKGAESSAARSARVEYLEQAVERLETEVSRLQQQVDFMEELLRTNAGSSRV